MTTGRQSAEALLEVINDILDFSKIEAGKLDFEDSGFSLAELIEGSCNLMKQRVSEKGLTLTSQLQEGLFDELIGDTGRIQQVLLNLISNAVKFTDEGSIIINGSSTSEISEEIRIRFEIIDSGIGIPEEMQGDIFSEFTMVDNSFTRNSEGTGLGLAISKKIVDMMEGDIGFESHLGEGSKFWFEIPLKKDTSDKLEKVTCAPINPRSDYVRAATVHRGNPGRILIAEDNTVNQMVTKVMLEKAGYRVDVASNVIEAIKAVMDLPYDIVLMDVSMPVMDGLEATRHIRLLNSRKANIPIIALTAHAMDKDEKNILAVGMNDYVSKPVNRDVLLEAIDRWSHERPWPEFQGSLDPENVVDETESEIPVLDCLALEQLAEDTYIELVPELVTTFLCDARGRVGKITAALANKDYDAVEHESHTLGSSSATFGAMRLHYMMREIEFACQQARYNELTRISVGMNEIAQNSFKSLEAYIKKI